MYTLSPINILSYLHSYFFVVSGRRKYFPLEENDVIFNFSFSKLSCLNGIFVWTNFSEEQDVLTQIVSSASASSSCSSSPRRKDSVSRVPRTSPACRACAVRTSARARGCGESPSARALGCGESPVTAPGLLSGSLIWSLEVLSLASAVSSGKPGGNFSALQILLSVFCFSGISERSSGNHLVSFPLLVLDWIFVPVLYCFDSVSGLWSPSLASSSASRSSCSVVLEPGLQSVKCASRTSGLLYWRVQAPRACGGYGAQLWRLGPTARAVNVKGTTALGTPTLVGTPPGCRRSAIRGTRPGDGDSIPDAPADPIPASGYGVKCPRLGCTSLFILGQYWHAQSVYAAVMSLLLVFPDGFCFCFLSLQIFTDVLVTWNHFIVVWELTRQQIRADKVFEEIRANRL